MGHLPKGSKRIISGFTAAFVACALPLSAAVAPLRTELASPIAKRMQFSPKASYTFSAEVKTVQINPELDLQNFARLESQFADYIEIKTERYIPTDLRQGDSQEKITKKILQTSLETWIDDTNVKNTNIGRSVASIQSGLSTEVSGKTAIRIQPLTATAQIIYKGEVEARVEYDLNDHDFRAKVSKQIKGTEYSVQHKTDNTESKNTVNFAWTF